jgi:hypothetical protein
MKLAQENPRKNTVIGLGGYRSDQTVNAGLETFAWANSEPFIKRCQQTSFRPKETSSLSCEQDFIMLPVLLLKTDY